MRELFFSGSETNVTASCRILPVLDYHVLGVFLSNLDRNHDSLSSNTTYSGPVGLRYRVFHYMYFLAVRNNNRH